MSKVKVKRMTLAEIEEKIIAKGGTCNTCGSLLQKGSIRSHPHKGGYNIDGYEQEQWIYFTCTCGIDSKIANVHMRIKVKEA